jgi:pyruvate,orthophosphate dikinase
MLDEHAELREVFSQIEEAADLEVLSGLLERLHELLRIHFAREEAAGGLLEMVSQVAGLDPAEVARLSLDHRELLAGVGDLLRSVQADEQRPISAIEPALAEILRRLRRHDDRETDLLAGALDDESGSASDRAEAADRAPTFPRSGDGSDATRRALGPIPASRRASQTQSKALEVNLRRTAVSVVIPPEQMVLLDITSDLYGVNESTKKLLREINHRYVGWAQTLDDLHRRATSDFAHYITRERAPEALEIFCGLYENVADQASSPSVRESAVRKLLYYLEKVAGESGERLPSILPVLERALSRLEDRYRCNPDLAVITSPRLRRFSEVLMAAAPDAGVAATERSLGLFAAALCRVYEQWLGRSDPAEWWRERSGADAAQALPAKLAPISHARLAASLEELRRLTEGEAPLRDCAAQLLALPDDAQIERGYLDAASCVESEDQRQNQLERIHWLIKVLSVEALGAVHEQALSEVSHSYLDVLRGADRPRLESFVRETFDILRQSELSTSRVGLNLISRIGQEGLNSGDLDWAEVVIGEIIDLDFPRPEFSGFTDEWGVQVNPAHLRAIRAHLAVIEANPQLARPLIAALVIQLRIGGVFVADTDLFQRDVSKLLNSDIGAVYHPVKHLLKIFPVYFNDIGAEGELREVSSRIDEIGARKDPLCHFLRKQSHVESNSLLIDFIEAIGEFWATGECAGLESYVPPALYEDLDIASPEYEGLRSIFARLRASRGLDELFKLEQGEIERRLEEIDGVRSIDREKAALLFKLRRLIGSKYELDHDDLLDRLGRFHQIEGDRVEALREALAARNHEAALEVLLGILEQLKQIIVSEERTEGVEDIYHKRHIAAGIPSMYGQYREEKFEAMGLSFRIESMANVLFEEMILAHNLEYINRSTLQRVGRWLRLILRALRVDGCQGRGLATGITMLDQALAAEGFSEDQYINIFQFISRSVEQLIRIRFFDVYEKILDKLLQRMLARGVLQAEEGSDEQESMLMLSEKFLRDLIAQSFGLQQLDNLVGKVLRTLVQWRERLDTATLKLLMTFDADRCCVPIDRHEGPQDGAIYLGNKGHMVKRLACDGLPVPNGFILTTEVFRCRAAILACEELGREVSEQIRQQVVRLEKMSGGRFGDPDRPLLVSVRSGAAISMPGVLDTFLNVGMNESVAEAFAARSGSAWAAWDAYRRFLQFWGMGHGLDRDLFDALMRECKQRFGVEKKSHFPAENMKQVAIRYRDFLLEQGVQITDDPFEQLESCVDLVLRSWHSKKARAYRNALQIAEDWGTAVIVQNMVYGNLNDRSGTGVALTCDPRSASGGMQLYGDFIVQGQGDDVVSGLVETFPITEAQRLSESKNAAVSLEKDFPQIYHAIAGHARWLIQEQGMFHQEIEFTFESDEPSGLFILQTRDLALSQEPTVPAFVPTDELERSKVATGIGAGSGALSGRVAHTAEDIAELRQRYPEDPVILLRPDTVPDDIPLILQSDGMVTAIGGATSHAALAAQRLGRTCVVGCRQLQVFEDRLYSKLADRKVATGDFISINGIDGSIYLGKHPSTIVRRQRLM